MSLRELRRAQGNPDPGYQDLLYMDIIYLHPNTTVSYIADVLNIAGTAVTARLNRMERNGWITRARSEKDRRQYIISLTGDAMRMYQEYEDDWARRMDLLCERYPEVRVDELLDMLKILAGEGDGACPSS